MFISHFHDPEDGFPNMEDLYDDGQSTSSVVKRSPKLDPEWLLKPLITTAVSTGVLVSEISSNCYQDIDHLSNLSDHSTVSTEVKQYLQNIIAFLRLHRAVAGGISALATKHFDKLTK
jgi:hypothetical protein